MHAFDPGQREIRKEDTQKHPGLLKQLANSDRPEVALQSQLKMKYESEVLDGVATVQRVARAGSWGHDGMFLHGVTY